MKTTLFTLLLLFLSTSVFSQEKGKIELTETRTTTTYRDANGTSSTNYITQYFSINGSEEKEATFKNLKDIVKSNSQSYRYLKTARNLKTTNKVFEYGSYGLALSAVGVIAYEIIRSSAAKKAAGNNPNNLPPTDYTLYYASAGLFSGGLVLFFTKGIFDRPRINKTRQAIEAYNKSF